MRIKFLVAKTLVLALPLTLLPVFASSAPRVTPGTKCKVQKQKIDYQGKTFTCIKSGNNLAWSKGVVIPEPKPLPGAKTSVAPAKATFSPWASSFDTDLMTSTALANTSKFLGDVKPSSDYKLTIDPAIKDSDRAWITKMLDYTNGAFSEILKGQVKVFLGTTHDWSAKTLRSAGEWIGDAQSPYPCSNGVNDAYCAEPNLALLIYSDMYRPNSTYRWDAGRRSTPAHELFHNVQFALGGRNVGPDDPTHIPRWLMEGSANYFGFYIVDKLGLDGYGYARYQQVNSNQAYKTVVPLILYDNFTSDPYGIGQAATEYLVASVGFEKFLNIWRFTKSEKDFAKGFKNAVGIDISDFYSKFEAARPSMNIGTS